MRVKFTRIVRRVRPKDHMDVLRPLLPARYSPLQANGNGIQSIYLTELTPAFAETLAGLIGQRRSRSWAASRSARRCRPATTWIWWEHRIEDEVETDTSIPPTEREAIIRARRGPGLFKERVMQIEQRCRITKVENPIHLVASHCKPWRDSDNQERLNGENGLLLTPSIDHLFDRGFIGFEDNGELIISPVAHRSRSSAWASGPASWSTSADSRRAAAELPRLPPQVGAAQGGALIVSARQVLTCAGESLYLLHHTRRSHLDRIRARHSFRGRRARDRGSYRCRTQGARPERPRSADGGAAGRLGVVNGRAWTVAYRLGAGSRLQHRLRRGGIARGDPFGSAPGGGKWNCRSVGEWIADDVVLGLAYALAAMAAYCSAEAPVAFRVLTKRS